MQGTFAANFKRALDPIGKWLYFLEKNSTAYEA